MAIQSNTLRPGFLVSLKTHIHGNVHYTKTILDDSVEDGGALRSRWETERTIDDPVELEAAKKARGKASSLIRAVCAQSAFGLLCPENAESELEAAIVEARKVADAFNETAKLSRVSVYVITGRVAQDDVEAVRAINSEVRDLLEDMSEGIEKLDVKRVRDAANKARNIGAMLSPNAEAQVKIAIETARKAARDIVKAGEAAAVEVDKVAIRKITEMRTSFLDLDDQREVAKPATQGRAIDFDAGGEVQCCPNGCCNAPACLEPTLGRQPALEF